MKLAKTFLAFCLAGSILLLGVAYISYREHRPQPALIEPLNRVEAVGLKGKARISKNLTSLQQERLEKHFVDTPALPVSNAPRSSVQQINQLNQFNAKQNNYEKK